MEKNIKGFVNIFTIDEWGKVQENYGTVVATDVELLIKESEGLDLLCLRGIDIQFDTYFNYAQSKEIFDNELRVLKNKKNVNRLLIKMIEKVIPEISKHITYKSLATPLSFERYNYVTKGSWYGPKYNQDLPPLETPIKNLFLAGSNTAGAGVSGSLHSGVKTAKHVIELVNKEITKEE